MLKIRRLQMNSCSSCKYCFFTKQMSLFQYVKSYYCRITSCWLNDDIACDAFENRQGYKVIKNYKKNLTFYSNY